MYDNIPVIVIDAKFVIIILTNKNLYLVQEFLIPRWFGAMSRV
jgi:hypothetical protein